MRRICAARVSINLSSFNLGLGILIGPICPFSKFTMRLERTDLQRSATFSLVIFNFQSFLRSILTIASQQFKQALSEQRLSFFTLLHLPQLHVQDFMLDVFSLQVEQRSKIMQEFA